MADGNNRLNATIGASRIVAFGPCDFEHVADGAEIEIAQPREVTHGCRVNAAVLDEPVVDVDRDDLSEDQRGIMAPGRFSVEFPARMLLDLLAGRMTEERFRKQLDARDESRNIFKTWLNLGFTISSAELAPRSIDEDDDHLVLHFTDDPAARLFKLPEQPAEDASAGAPPSDVDARDH